MNIHNTYMVLFLTYNIIDFSKLHISDYVHGTFQNSQRHMDMQHSPNFNA